MKLPTKLPCVFIKPDKVVIAKHEVTVWKNGRIVANTILVNTPNGVVNQLNDI